MVSTLSIQRRKMGQSLIKLALSSQEKKMKECWDIYFKESDGTEEFVELYRAICCTIEEINQSLGHTQIRVPKTDVLEAAFDKHRPRKDTTLTKEEFQKILEDVMTNTGFTRIVAKDTLLYIFGVPVIALFVKQGVMPGAIPNEILIPGVTSITVLTLAMLKKI